MKQKRAAPRRSISGFLSNNKVVLIISVIIAVVCWMMIAVNYSDDYTTVIAEVPVTIPTTGDSGLSAVLDETPTVKVTVVGKRSTVSTLTADDISVTVPVTAVTSAGEFVLPVVASQEVQDSDYQISSVEPSELTLQFDHIITKEYQITAQATDIQAADGYIRQTAYTSVTSVSITGPQTELAEISTLTATPSSSSGNPRTESLVCEAVLTATDAQGNELSDTHWTYSEEEITITVPIYKRVTVPITFSLSNTPNGLTSDNLLDTLSYTMSVTEIELAVPAENANAVTSLSIGQIDCSTLTPTNYTYTLDVGLPSGYVNIQDVQQVTVTFDMSNYAAALYEVSNFSILNANSGWTVSMVTTQLENVTIVGNSNLIAALQSENITLGVDFSGITSVSEGEMEMPVVLITDSGNIMWLSGSYSVIVNVSTSG